MIDLPENVFAGVLPAVPGRQREAVWHAGAEVCGTEDIHMVHRTHEGRIWYVVTRSADFASRGDLATVLDVAFPSHPDHRGPGAYLFCSAGRMLVIVTGGGTVESFLGQPATAIDFAARNARRAVVVSGSEAAAAALAAELAGRFGEPPLWLAADAITPTTWVGFRILSEKELLRIFGVAGKAGWVAAALTSLLAVVALANLMTSSISGSALDDQRQRDLARLTQSVEQFSRSAAREQVVRLRESIAEVARFRGRMRTYRIAGGQTALVIDMPAYVGNEVIRRLAPAGKVDMSPETGRITISQGKLRGN